MTVAITVLHKVIKKDQNPVFFKLLKKDIYSIKCLVS